jgi:hypothetical protein
MNSGINSVFPFNSGAPTHASENYFIMERRWVKTFSGWYGFKYLYSQPKRR